MSAKLCGRAVLRRRSGRRDGAPSRDRRWVTMVGRLKPGITLAQARSRFQMLTRDMQAAHPEEWLERGDGTRRELFVTVLSKSSTRVHPQLRAPAYALSALLFVIVDVVLVIACMNLASIALRPRGREAQRVRRAPGAEADRWRIIRQLLTESLLQSIVVGVVGIVLAVWALDALTSFMPASSSAASTDCAPLGSASRRRTWWSHRSHWTIARTIAAGASGSIERCPNGSRSSPASGP